jgi:hypothetical protein
MNYEDDIRIDETSLDVEWLEQASLAMRYGKHYAIARRRFIQAEEKVKVIRAELIAEANADPVKCCNKDKPNVADIEAYYRNHKRHKTAKEEWVVAQYELDMAEIAKNEISFTRKVALENLVRLHGQQYFAGPKIPRDLAWEREQKQKNVDAGVGSHLSRKPRTV